MKVIITGANSFIGKKLIKKGLEQGWELVLVTHTAPAIQFPETKTLHLAMEDYDRLGVLAGSCDCFVHLAWDGTRGGARMDVAKQEKNVVFSLDAIRSVLHQGCKRIILAGSQAEYGLYTERISEESMPCPNTEYGKAKLSLYQQAHSLCQKSGAELIEPRFFSLYGPGDYAGTMIMSILQDMIAGRPCRLTKCIQKWDYLYVDDAIEALMKLCERKYPSGVYNFGSGNVRTLREYVLEMAQITGTTSKLEFGAISYPKTGAVSLWPDVSKLKHTLNWEPNTSFAAGIRNILKEK